MKTDEERLTIEKDKGNYYLYWELESGNHVCVGVFNKKRECEAERDRMLGKIVDYRKIAKVDYDCVG